MDKDGMVYQAKSDRLYKENKELRDEVKRLKEELKLEESRTKAQTETKEYYQKLWIEEKRKLQTLRDILTKPKE